MSDYVSEWYRCATHAPHPVTRRQIVKVPGGYQLTPVELVGKGPASLRDYDGGWQFPSKIYPALAGAERQLVDNGYTPEMPEPGTPPQVRSRSGSSGTHTVPQRAVRVEPTLWDAAGIKAARLGTDRNAVINELLLDWVNTPYPLETQAVGRQLQALNEQIRLLQAKREPLIKWLKNNGYDVGPLT